GWRWLRIAEWTPVKRISLKEVAQNAAVSLSTASLALRDSPKVTEETRKRIQSIAEELGYRPSFVARRLSSGRSRVLGLVLRPMPSELGMEVLYGVAQHTSSRGFTLLIEHTDGRYEQELQAVRRLMNEHVDGVLLQSAVRDEDPQHLLELVKRGTPIVQMGMRAPGIESDYVAYDNRGGARRLVQYLLDRGHRRIACLSNASGRRDLAERIEGYQLVLTEAGIKLEPGLVAVDAFADVMEPHGETCGSYGPLAERPHWPDVKAALRSNQHQTLTTMRRWFKSSSPPTAVFAAHRGAIASVLWGLRTLNLSVPNDVSLVAFDELPYLPALGFEVTTMIQLGFELGYEAARLLVDRIEGSALGGFRSVRFQPQFVEGNSVRRLTA
ncbi:MAG: LacI family DNA-binding transcriptional regulator, partial [Candidatus Latescibacterota bacterium]